MPTPAEMQEVVTEGLFKVIESLQKALNVQNQAVNNTLDLLVEACSANSKITSPSMTTILHHTNNLRNLSNDLTANVAALINPIRSIMHPPEEEPSP